MNSNRSRITKPPGGEASDIFGQSPTSTPPTTPRKVKNYMASTIFTNGEGNGSVKAKQRPDNDSFKRLFGVGGDLVDGQTSPRMANKSHQKSSILFNDATKATNGHDTATPNGLTNGESNGHVDMNGGGHSPTPPATNGHTTHFATNNGHYNTGGGSTGSISGPSSGSSTPNGSINGDYKSNGYTNGNGGMPTTPSRRIPPGGYSSKLW